MWTARSAWSCWTVSCHEAVVFAVLVDKVLGLNIAFSVYRVNSRVSADFGEDAQQVKKDTELEGEMHFCLGFCSNE